MGILGIPPIYKKPYAVINASHTGKSGAACNMGNISHVGLPVGLLIMDQIYFTFFSPQLCGLFCLLASRLVKQQGEDMECSQGVSNANGR